MNYLLDTNIVLAYVRQAEIMQEIDSLYDPFGEGRTPAISVVSVGEIKSIAIRNRWGNRKITLLETLLNKFVIADINVGRIIERYAEIDAFSQVNYPIKRLHLQQEIWAKTTFGLPPLPPFLILTC